MTTLKTCDAGISCNSFSAHFRDTHGVKGIEEVNCLFKGCHKCVSGKNFNRHIRETHLGHPRTKKDDS